VAFPTGIERESCDAETQFAVLRRSLDLPTGTEGWPEQPLRTAPTRGFVDVGDGTRGLALLSRGLPEYEAAPENGAVSLYLTLLRSVGWLSRGDLWTRPAYCGPGLPTPGAQCLGRHSFEYAIVPHPGDWQEAGLITESADFRAPARAVDVTSPAGVGTLPSEMRFVALDPPTMRISAVKWSEEGDRLIVRAFNASPTPERASFRPCRMPRSVDLVNLNEDVESALSVAADGAVELDVRPWGIVTLAFDV
jgi:mannosylglycerate hydrolase